MAVHPPWTEQPPAAEPSVAPQQPARNAFQVNGTIFEVPSNLHFLRAVGCGTYGSVSAFRDDITGTEVAIKKITNPFRNIIDGKRCLREIKLLQLLEHDCIIPILDILAPASPDYHEVYLVTELMDADLHTVICSEQPLSDDHVQFFTYHILRALLYVHSANVVHRDLKPLNVLVNKNCDIKLCDFGLARGRAGFCQEDDEFLRTEYVGTRWYRAPEIVLTSMEYTAAVDIWSVGCILGELIGRSPMFRGKDFLDQIRSICDVLGTPTDDELSFIPHSNQAARDFIKCRFPGLQRRNWQTMFPSASPEQCDMLDKMLHFDPSSRLTALDALHHPYLAEQYCDEDEMLADAHINWDFDDETEPTRLQCLIYHEAAARHPEIVERDRAELISRGWLAGDVDTAAPAAPAAAAQPAPAPAALVQEAIAAASQPPQAPAYAAPEVLAAAAPASPLAPPSVAPDSASTLADAAAPSPPVAPATAPAVEAPALGAAAAAALQAPATAPSAPGAAVGAEALAEAASPAIASPAAAADVPPGTAPGSLSSPPPPPEHPPPPPPQQPMTG